MAAKYDCWALMADNGSVHNFLFASLAGKALSQDSQGFEAGISVHDGLAMDVVMRVKSERSAKQLHGNLNRLIHIAGPEKGSDFTGLLRKLRITSDKDSVSMTLRMSNVEVAQTLHPNGKDGSDRPLVAQTPGRIGEADRRIEPLIPPPPPKPLVIRIEGLDEGAREIPYKP